MKRHPEAIAWLIKVANSLGQICEEVVFLGGATVSLLITEPAAYIVRPTKDVDIIVEISSRAEYSALRDQLVQCGFREDTDEDAPLCRWVIDDIKVDVMPTDDAILGFTNRWYRPAMLASVRHQLAKGIEVRRVSAPYFIATKLEAFHSRGDGDYQLSHDVEDVIAVIDGRLELAAEVGVAPIDVHDYIRDQLAKFLANRAFQDALRGHLPGDQASQARLPQLLERLKVLAELF